MVTTVAPTFPRVGPERSPLRTWVLTLATLGIYGVVHHYLVNRELRDFGVEVKPTLSVIAVVPGLLLVVPPFASVWRTADRIAVAQETVGLRPSARAAVASLSTIALLAVTAYHQRELNRVWSAAGSESKKRSG